MADFEGSVMMEGFEEAEDSQEESTSEEQSENINKSEDESQQEESSQEETQEEAHQEEVKRTDKGTKLDPNPQSAVHQRLANAEREAKEYREFMQNPEQVKRYLEELEAAVGKKTGESQQEIQNRAEEETLIDDPSKIVTPEDFQSYVKFLKRDIDKTKAELVKERESIRTEAGERAITQRLVNEIDTIQSKYSFLRPTLEDGKTPNPEFDKELEKEIADQYDEFDKDPRTGKYLGKTSILKVAERAIRIRKLGEATGSRSAQTTVLNKRAGALKTSGGQSGSSDESKMTATQLIASRMNKARSNR